MFNILTNLAMLGLVLIVSKRAIQGPQKMIARLVVMLVLMGFASADSSGALFVLAGLWLAVIMMCVDTFWTVKTALEKNSKS